MPPTKRLLIVTNRFHPQVGGAEFNILQQARALSEHFAVDVFTPMRDRNPRREVLDGVSITRGFNFKNLGRRYPDLNPEAICPEVFFKTLLGGYDVVHCFPALNRNNIMALTAAKLRGIPVFLSMFDLDDYATLLDGGIPLDRIFQNQVNMAAKWRPFFRKFNGIFTISTRETANIKTVNENTFLSTVPILIDEYDQSIDVDDFKKRYQIRPNVPLILCLGRVAHLKGQDVLIRALPRLRERFPDAQALIVGRTDHEPKYFAELQSLVEKEHLQEQVRFTGVVPREDVIAALKACDVHVLPVRFMNSGAVVIETWAANKPVLHSDAIDPCYVVEGENGYTFHSEDAQDLCDKLVSMLENPGLCADMGASGRKLVEDKFLYPHLIRQYMEAYRDLGGVETEQK
jgi:glycosyltransferase involved in cell wall biosynthesis